MSASGNFPLCSIYFFIVLSFYGKQVGSLEEELPKCPKPDYPLGGNYGPKQDFYLPGDRIHYFCDVDTFIGGNFLRICLDTGDWTGEAPVCDAPMKYLQVTQSTTKSPAEENRAERAVDGSRSKCSSTRAEPGSSWTATFFEKVRELLRVMVFLPKGRIAYEVISIRSDGAEFSCGRFVGEIVRYEWVFHNCLAPNNTNIIALRIRSLSSEPLRLCEVITHSLTDPTCVGPRMQIENGHLIVTRKEATLACDEGFRKSKTNVLKCIRTGEWQRRTMFCEGTDIEVENVPGSVELDDDI